MRNALIAALAATILMLAGSPADARCGSGTQSRGGYGNGGYSPRSQAVYIYDVYYVARNGRHGEWQRYTSTFDRGDAIRIASTIRAQYRTSTRIETRFWR